MIDRMEETMNHPFNYIGCFVKSGTLHKAIRSIRQKPLENDIQFPHITFSYMPEEVNQELFGTLVSITVIGYGNDGNNEGLLVQLSSENIDVQEMIDKIQVPHITISVSNNGQPVNTRYLSFSAIEPIHLTGKVGGYAYWGKVIFRRRKK